MAQDFSGDFSDISKGVAAVIAALAAWRKSRGESRVPIPVNAEADPDGIEVLLNAVEMLAREIEQMLPFLLRADRLAQALFTELYTQFPQEVRNRLREISALDYDYGKDDASGE